VYLLRLVRRVLNAVNNVVINVMEDVVAAESF